MQPPTYRSWGVGRAWHKKGGRIYYLTIPIAPFGLNCKDTTTNAIIYNKLDVTNKTIYSTVTTPKQYKIQLKTDFTTNNKFLKDIAKIDWYKIKQKDLNKNQLYDEKSLQYVGTIKNPKQGSNYLTTYIDGSPEGKQHIFGAKITYSNGLEMPLKDNTWNGNMYIVSVTVKETLHNIETDVNKTKNKDENIDKDKNIDLAITDIKYDKYPANSKVSSVISIINNSQTDVYDVPVLLEFEYKKKKIQKVRSISIMKKGKANIIYNFNTPNEDCFVNLKAIVNSNNTYKEINKANNIKKITAHVIKISPSIGCEETRNWIEWDSREESRTGYKRKKGTKITKDENGNNITEDYYYYEPYTYYVTVWYDFKYQAILNADVKIDPEVLKSGYGFNVEVYSKITYHQVSGKWDRKPKNIPTQVKYVKITTPFSEKAYYLQKITGNKFITPINDESIIDARVIYTPVSLPGTAKNPLKHPILIKIYGSNTPAGELCKTITKYITINGNMYEDDNTS